MRYQIPDFSVSAIKTELRNAGSQSEQLEVCYKYSDVLDRLYQDADVFKLYCKRH